MLFRRARSWHKTGAEMNAQLVFFDFMTGARVRGLVYGTCVLALCGCATVDSRSAAEIKPSPLAGLIASKSAESGSFPTFAQIPPVPGDVRPLPAFGTAARDLDRTLAELEAQTAPGTWTLSGTEAYAARAQALAGPDTGSSISTTAATEAFARQARARATPPPPPR